MPSAKCFCVGVNSCDLNNGSDSHYIIRLCKSRSIIPTFTKAHT